MSRDVGRKGYFPRDPRDPRERRDSNRDRDDYHGGRMYDARRPLSRKRSLSRGRGDADRRPRSRSPRLKAEKEMIDDNILSEISKLPEPSELWESQNNFPPPPHIAPPFTHESVPSANPGYPNYGAQPSYSGIYDDFPPTISAVPPNPQPPEWNQMALPPPPAAPSSTFIPNIEDQIKKEAAIESEMRHQKAALSKQREDYIKKAGILKKELDTLKDQRNELRGDSRRSPSPDTKRFLKENTKLQLEIQNKLKTINNVVDMLNGIIGEEAQETVESDESGEPRTTKRKSRSPSSGKKFNYVYYDPEMHWCRVCNEFPPTAKDYLNHLHSPAHHKMAAQHMEAPWHTVTGINEGFPSYPSAPTKRTPIRGLQFFVPSTAWYCKLCDQFIGDLHCASAHLKSIVHSKNYSNFVEQNPHWETDWMSDRQKSVEKSRARGKAAPPVKAEPEPEPEAPKPQYTAHTITFHKEGFHTNNRKQSPPPAPAEEKKKKKEKKKSKKRKKSKSSSSSSDSSSSSSDSDDSPSKKKKKKKKTKESDEKMLSEWMSSINSTRLTEKDRKLLDSLKSKIKQEKPSPERSARERERDREREKEREKNIADMQKKIRESERERRGERRSRTRDTERRRSPSRAASTAREAKKPEIRKMPFIGKMPVYKSLGKAKEEQKKEEDKKKEDDEAAKKRQAEIDAEIQKKVAEFKEKIAKAQMEREQAAAVAPTPDLGSLPDFSGLIPPPGLVMPAALPVQPPLPPMPAPVVTPAPTVPAVPAVPNLPKDFQDALDIIFPTDQKAKEQAQDLFNNMPPIPGFPCPLPGMPPFPPLMPNFMGFDMNQQMFQPRPQLYDTHVPLVPSQKPRQQGKNIRMNMMKQNYNKKQQHNQQNKNQQNRNQNQNQQNKAKEEERQKIGKDAQAQQEKNGAVAKKKEELEDLAMLGIDASDVGANC